MKNLFKYFEKLIYTFIIIVIGFAIFDIATFKARPPSFYSLGITSNSVILKFAELGFNFNSSDSIFKQPSTIGLSGDKDALIELIGPKENLVNIKIVVFLTKGLSKTKLNLLRSYLENMIRLVLPTWIEGDKWLEESALKFKGSGGSHYKKVNNIKLTLTASKVSNDYFTLGLAIGDWERMPKYNSGKQIWYTND